jgi:hypothetical protein
MTQTRNELHRTLQRKTNAGGIKGPTFDNTINSDWEVYLTKLQDLIEKKTVTKERIETLLSEWLQPITPQRLLKTGNDILGRMDPRYPYCEYLKNNIHENDPSEATKKSVLSIINDYMQSKSINPDKYHSELIQANEILKNHNGPTTDASENETWETHFNTLNRLKKEKRGNDEIYALIDTWLEPTIRRNTIADSMKGKLDNRFIYIQYFIDRLHKTGNNYDARDLITLLESYCTLRGIPDPLNPPEEQ